MLGGVRERERERDRESFLWFITQSYTFFKSSVLEHVCECVRLRIGGACMGEQRVCVSLIIMSQCFWAEFFRGDITPTPSRSWSTSQEQPYGVFCHTNLE